MHILRTNSQHKPIVFLPGFGFQASIWQSIANQLPQHNCCLCDLPQKDISTSLDTVTTALAATIPVKSVIVAWSLGGLIAMYLCHRFPEKCCKLIVVASTPKFVAAHHWPGVSSTRAHQLYRTAVHDLPHLLQQFLQWVAYPCSQKKIRLLLRRHLLPIQHHTSLLAYLALLFDTDILTAYQQLTTPLLAIFGQQDHILPIAVAQQLPRTQAAHTIQIIPDAGHAPFLTHPTGFLKILNDFIER